MKKRAKLLLIVPALSLLLSGCTVQGGVRRAKGFLKKCWNKGISILDNFFADSNPNKTADGVIYTIRLPK